VDHFDFLIIGAGPAGEAAAFKARELGATAAIVDREWFGGSCPHIGCLPSKSLLHSASRQAAGSDYPWSRASAQRDWMVNRAADSEEPDDRGHVRRLEEVGAVTMRGKARITGRGRVEIRPRRAAPGRDAGPSRSVEADHVVIAVGSTSRVPPVDGLDQIRTWTNREATLARELPQSLLVLGGGPTGCELAQVYARYGVRTTIVQSGPRLLPSDHPRNAEAVVAGLDAAGVTVRTGVRAVRARAGAGADGADAVDLDDGSSVEPHATLLAVGRDVPLAGLGLEAYGIDADGAAFPRDGRLRIDDGLWAIGDAAGPELHTHQGHYQGELAVRMALGEAVTPDYRALPRVTYTDPEAASVGLTLEQAEQAGIDAFECVADFATTSRGYTIEATGGHVTIVVDRATRELVGAAIACPDASSAIHECVLAIRARVPMEVLADTIHAFPSTSRILNGLFADATRQLGGVTDAVTA
jgi:pyruvate/2-oxoglutarate dehydrogenase complex dihydrolipoamide dehydrogenase (E3) component